MIGPHSSWRGDGAWTRSRFPSFFSVEKRTCGTVTRGSGRGGERAATWSIRLMLSDRYRIACSYQWATTTTAVYLVVL